MDVTAKVYCPPLYYKESDRAAFIHFLDIVSYINVVVNTYTIYCIIFRSTKYMNRYRWFLLYHQCIAVVTDITIGILIKPLFLVPFAAGYPLGPLRGVVSTAHLTALVFFLLCLSVGTVTHLFTFRYAVAQGKSSIPIKFRAIMVFFVVITVLPGIGTVIAFQEEEVNEMATKYTCLTMEVISVPGFILVDRMRFGIFVAIPIAFNSTSFTVAANWFILATKKLINIDSASKKLKQMQRKFLTQVVIQAFLPLSIVLVPAFVLIITVIAEFYGLEFIGLVTMASMSVFGLGGALVLLVMNPTYHWWLMPVIRRIKTTDTNRSTVVVIGILIKPLFLVPFAAGYPLGPLREIIATVYLTALVFFLLCLSVGTVTHLFTFRYTVAQGKRKIPFKFQLLMAFFIVIAILPAIGTVIGYREGDVIEMAAKYSCITEEVISVPAFLLIERLRFGMFVAGPIAFTSTSFTIAANWFIIATKRVIHTDSASEKLKRMQRQFLLQVVIQAFLPLSIVLVPSFVLIITVVAEIYGLEIIGLATMASISVFGLGGALVLIIMNPTYHWWLTPIIRKLKITDGSRSAVMIISQHHTRSQH